MLFSQSDRFDVHHLRRARGAVPRRSSLDGRIARGRSACRPTAALALALIAAALAPSVAHGQCGITASPTSSPCSSGCGALAAAQGLTCVDGMANDNGSAVSTNAAFAQSCATNPTGQGFHRSHAVHFPLSGSFQLSHVCIGLNGTSFAGTTTGFNDVFVQVYSGSGAADPTAGTLIATSSPGASFTINGNRILAKVGPVTLTSDFWIVVTYNNSHPQVHRQLVAPRSGGRAMLRLSGTGVSPSCYPARNVWYDYDTIAALPQGSTFCGMAPVVRPLSLLGSPSGTAAFIATPSSGLTTSESGLASQFTVRLSQAPSVANPVLVRVTTSDSSEAMLRDASGALVSSLIVGPFSSASYSLPRVVDVVGVDDGLDDGDQNYLLDVVHSSGDVAFSAAATVVSGRNRDDETTTTAPNPAWVDVPVAAAPTARRRAAVAYDDARQEIVVFGGHDRFGSTFGDTWVYRNNIWQQVASVGPAPRWGSAMVYDSVRQRIVLFGGHTASSSFNDTWEWNGTSWSQVFPTVSIPGRRGEHAMAYDSARQRVVLYGGRNTPTGSVYDDTYEMSATPDGAGGFDLMWSFRGASLPGERRGAAMAYDPDTARTVLFGGYFGGGILGGTYTWNGVSWTLASTTGPAERQEHAMAFDGARRRVVLQGGFDGATMYDHTYEWDGAVWKFVMATNGPTRAMHRMVSAGSGGPLFVFGGINALNEDLDELACFQGGVTAHTYHVSGAGTGIPFQIGVHGPGFGSVSPVLVATPGLPAGSVAGLISGAATALPGVIGAQPYPGAPHVVSISFAGAQTALAGHAASAPPYIVAPGAPPVHINPEITEIFLSGEDCNANGMDDTIDLLDNDALDTDGNGVIDACEESLCPADVDETGTVDVSDLLAVLGAWGECAGCAADIDRSEVVDVLDLLAVLAAWGPCDEGDPPA